MFADAPEALVVAITCEVLPAFRDHLTRLGVREIVLKPYDNPQLIFQTIERAIEEVAAAASRSTTTADDPGAASRRQLSSLAGHAACQVLLSSCGILARQAGTAARQTVGGALTVISEIEGSWNGRAVIGIDRRLAEQLGARLYCETADEDTSVESEDLEDALAEIANVIIGNLTGALPRAATHSKPQVLGRQVDTDFAGLSESENPVCVATDYGFLTIAFVNKNRAAAS